MPFIAIEPWMLTNMFYEITCSETKDETNNRIVIRLPVNLPFILIIGKQVSISEV